MRFSTKTIFLSLVLLALGVGLKANEATDFKWPEHKITPIFKNFIGAYNSNDPDKLLAFTSAHFEKDFEKIAAYWPSVFADFGQIEPYSIDEEYAEENLMGLWCQGKQTKGWVMIIFRMNMESSKIDAKGVVRGDRPPGKLPSYEELSSEEKINYLEGYIEDLVELDRFSGAVLIAKGEDILFNKSYGESNKKLKSKNDSATSFNIASTSKTFTAISIALLAERGMLAFSDKIDKYIPEYPKDISSQLSIHHLLTHSSGIELDDYEPFNDQKDKAKSMEDLLQAQLMHIDSMNEGRRKDFQVLNEFDYSNENFDLLGLIIERVSGLSYAEFVEANILEVLDMKSSFASAEKLIAFQNRAIGYSTRNTEGEFLGGKRVENDRVKPHFLRPDGGIYSSVSDLYTYFKAINQDKLVSANMKETIFKRHFKRYGYGFEVFDHKIGHRGVYSGVGSHFNYYPASDYYIIILSNYGAMAGSVINDHIEDVILPRN